MNVLLRALAVRVLPVAFASVLVPRAISGDDVRTVTIFEGRQIAVGVPAGWKFEEEFDPHHGSASVRVQDPQGDVALVVLFFPDRREVPEGREGLEADARRLFEPYLETAVEKEMALTYFEAPDGGGVYASFTDAALDPRSVPDDERLISTAGLRSMRGVYVLFTVLSNSRDSAAFRRALDLVRAELRQVKQPVAF